MKSSSPRLGPQANAGSGSGQRETGVRRFVRPAVLTALTVPSLLVAVSPSLIKPALAIVSRVHPTVSISVDAADVGWLTPKPRLDGITVRSKLAGTAAAATTMKTTTTLFSAASIRGDTSLLNAVLARGRRFNVFVERPRVGVFDPANVPARLGTSPFSAEVSLDDRVHLFVSEGTLVVDAGLEQLLGGRLFVDVVKDKGSVRVEADGSDGLAVRGDFALKNEGRDREVVFVRPVEVRARVNQAFVTSVLGTVNPLLSNAVAVEQEGQPVTVRVAPVGGGLKLGNASDMRIEVDGYRLKIKPGALVDEVLEILKLNGERSRAVIVESSPAKVVVTTNTNTNTSRVEAVMERVSIGLSAGRRVVCRVSTVVDGSAAEISNGTASLDMRIDVLPETLLDLMKIKSSKSLRVDARGTTSRPVVLVRDAVMRLGALVVGSWVEA